MCSHLVVNSSQLLVKCKAIDCDVGLQLGRNDRGLAAGFSGGSEGIGRYFMPKVERSQRLREALEGLKQLSGLIGESRDSESTT